MNGEVHENDSVKLPIMSFLVGVWMTQPCKRSSKMQNTSAK